MSIRCVFLASVSSAFLAACVAASGTAFAASQSPSILQSVQAYKALTAGDQISAIAAYTQAIESQDLPTEALANALLNRGLAYQQINEHQEAIDDYSSALQLDAMSATLRATALYNRGLSQQKLARLSAAIEDFTSALFLDPEFAMSYYGRGNALRESGQSLFALSDYEKALRYHHPDAARVHYAEALTYENLKRPADTRKALELALAANPSFKPAGDKLAMLQGGDAAPAKPMALAAFNVGGGELTVRKPDQPKAVEPSAELMNEQTTDPLLTASVDLVVTTPSSKIVDRIPVDEPAVVNAAAAEEKVIAVEAVDDVTPVAEPVVEEAVSAEEVATEGVPASGWSVQVASAESESAAWSTWKKMQARHKTLAGQKPVVMKADLGSKGIFYRVRLAGFDDQGAAKSTCSKLKAKGVSCFVSKINS